MVCGCCDLCIEKEGFTLKSFYEWAEGLDPWRDELIYVLVHQDHGKKWVEEGKCNTVAGCDLCHMWEALLYERPPSVCMYLCVWCTWGAESTSEWESTVQGAALLLTKGRPFCFILLMYTVWLNVDITEWGMYSNEYCEGNINLH